MQPGFPIQVSKNKGDRDRGKGVDRMLAQNCKQTALRREGKREKDGVAARWFIRGKRRQEGVDPQDLQRMALSEVISLRHVAAPGHVPHMHVQEGPDQGQGQPPQEWVCFTKGQSSPEWTGLT